MQSFRRILVAVDLSHSDRIVSADLSAPTEAAVGRALWLAGRVGGEVAFLAVVDVSQPTREFLEQQTVGEAPTFLELARQALDGLVERAAAQNVRASSKIVFGASWREIIREALAGPHDLVLAGTRDLSRATRLLFGSTGMRLLRCCPRPVWITRPDLHPEEFDVLVATDFSETSQIALETAVGLGQLADVRLHVLHAQERPLDLRIAYAGIRDPEKLDELKRQARDEAERKTHEQLSRTDYRTLKYGVQVQVADGSADVAVLDYIDQHQIDLVVMGSVARAGLAGLVVGNTAERLLPQIPCSILAVKPDGFLCPVSFDD